MFHVAFPDASIGQEFDIFGLAVRGQYRLVPVPDDLLGGLRKAIESADPGNGSQERIITAARGIK